MGKDKDKEPGRNECKLTWRLGDKKGCFCMKLQKGCVLGLIICAALGGLWIFMGVVLLISAMEGDDETCFFHVGYPLGVPTFFMLCGVAIVVFALLALMFGVKGCGGRKADPNWLVAFLAFGGVSSCIVFAVCIGGFVSMCSWLVPFNNGVAGVISVAAIVDAAVFGVFWYCWVNVYSFYKKSLEKQKESIKMRKTLEIRKSIIAKMSSKDKKKVEDADRRREFSQK